MKTQINQLLLVVIVLNIATMIGCHRSYYRRQADAEARRLIREKSVDPRWDSADGTIDIDPMSRMFNPFSKDHPPIPPDDASSHQLMHHVDGKEGYPHWHANGDTDYVEAPEWMNYLPMNEKGQVVLTLERAYELALLHSPDLQEQRERLYLSALSVSLERFGFDSQLFTGFNSFFTTQGRLRNGTSSSTFQTQLGANGGGLNIQRAGITGANFAVGLANTILFNFAGNNTQSATSLIDFSVIQPLLRGAGRDRILESLTQSERDLLANVRQLERFRRGFYLQVAIGRNPGAGVSGNLLGAPGAASANAGGFFGLLQTQQNIRNLEFNVRQLEAVLEQFKEFFMRERLEAIDLKLFENNVFGQQSRLLQAKNNYERTLDQFKISLGLPPDLDVVIEDSFLDRFELISDEINGRLIDIGDLRRTTGSALNKVDSLFDASEEPGFKWADFKWPSNLQASIEELLPYIDQAESTVTKILGEDRKLVEKDLDKLEDKRKARLAYLKDLQDSIASGAIVSSVSPDLFKSDSVKDADELRILLDNPEVDELEFVMEDDERVIPSRSIIKRARLLKDEIASVRGKIKNFANAEAELKKLPGERELDPELYDYILSEFQQTIPGLLSELNNLTLEMSLLQALARSNSIEINNVSIDAEHAVRVARCMRRDWMNARAGLVDQYRNIEFVADQLEAQVDLVFQGDIGNTGDNPLKLRYETGQLRAGIRFDAPIVRISERNNYRNALISYQQSRRSYYQFEDSIKSNLRQIIRNIDQNKVLFELNRATVQTSIENVEISRYELEAPVGVNASARVGNATQRNLTDSIRNLNNAQDSFLGSWIQLEVLRRNLDFDLGTMQLDEMSRWVDPGEIDSSIGIRTADMMGIQLDCQFCDNIGTSYSTQIVGESVIDQSLEQQYESAPSEPQLKLEGSTIEPINVEQPGFEGSLQPVDGNALQAPSPETSMFRQQRNLRLERERSSGSMVPQRIMSPITVSSGDLSSKQPVQSNNPAIKQHSVSSNQGSIVPAVVPKVVPKVATEIATKALTKDESLVQVEKLLKPEIATKVSSQSASVALADISILKTNVAPVSLPSKEAVKPLPIQNSSLVQSSASVGVAKPPVAPESRKVVQASATKIVAEPKPEPTLAVASSSTALPEPIVAPTQPTAQADLRTAPKTVRESVPEQQMFVPTKRISASPAQVASMPKLVVSVDSTKRPAAAPSPKFRAPSMLNPVSPTTPLMRPLPLLSSQVQKVDTPATPKEAFPWESDPASFGGLLNRFKSTRDTDK